jgi:hypothetical protein
MIHFFSVRHCSNRAGAWHRQNVRQLQKLSNFCRTILDSSRHASTFLLLRFKSREPIHWSSFPPLENLPVQFHKRIGPYSPLSVQWPPGTSSRRTTASGTTRPATQTAATALPTPRCRAIPMGWSMVHLPIMPTWTIITIHSGVTLFITFHHFIQPDTGDKHRYSRRLCPRKIPRIAMEYLRFEAIFGL